jgi:hypothetical protein
MRRLARQIPGFARFRARHGLCGNHGLDLVGRLERLKALDRDEELPVTGVYSTSPEEGEAPPVWQAEGVAAEAEPGHGPPDG